MKHGAWMFSDVQLLFWDQSFMKQRILYMSVNPEDAQLWVLAYKKICRIINIVFFEDQTI